MRQVSPRSALYSISCSFPSNMSLISEEQLLLLLRASTTPDRLPHQIPELGNAIDSGNPLSVHSDGEIVQGNLVWVDLAFPFAATLSPGYTPRASLQHHLPVFLLSRWEIRLTSGTNDQFLEAYDCPFVTSHDDDRRKCMGRAKLSGIPTPLRVHHLAPLSEDQSEVINGPPRCITAASQLYDDDKLNSFRQEEIAAGWGSRPIRTTVLENCVILVKQSVPPEVSHNWS